jgi:hypothetical protein
MVAIAGCFDVSNALKQQKTKAVTREKLLTSQAVFERME